MYSHNVTSEPISREISLNPEPAAAGIKSERNIIPI